MNQQSGRGDLDDAARHKLPYERDHVDALQRMKTLEAYYDWTRRQFGGFVGRRVLDAGCGVGSFMDLVAPDVELLVGIDLSEDNLAIANDRFRDLCHVSVSRRDLDGDISDLQAAAFDTVALLDVLEHVENDTRLLVRLRQIVAPSGYLLVKVPGCPFLFGAVDVASGHFRRYSRQLLMSRVEAAGWSVISCRYMNLAGVLPYWLKSVVLRRESNFSRTFTPRQLAMIRRLVPVAQWIDRVTGPPIGQSIVLIAQRRDSGART